MSVLNIWHVYVLLQMTWSNKSSRLDVSLTVFVCFRYKDNAGFVLRLEPFSIRDVLRPPFRATHRTSKNVTILTIIICESSFITPPHTPHLIC